MSDNLKRAELNGQPATIDDFRALALVNYGHFTSMQVREGQVRGLGLHLERLNRSTQEMFGSRLDPDQVRDYMQHIMGDNAQSLSMRVTVFSRDLGFMWSAKAVAPDVLITLGTPVVSDLKPLRVQSVQHERVLPHIKHVGTLGLFHYPRLANINGFDDALFVTHEGYISEGSIWNVGFFTEGRVVWPDAPALPGITMQLIQAGLERRGIPQEKRAIRLEDLGAFTSAFTTNSVAVGQPISSINDHSFKVDDVLTALLNECYESNAWDAISQADSY